MLSIGLVLNITPEKGKAHHTAFLEYIDLAIQAEQIGFDSVFALEHHFTDYVLSPTPLQLLTYLAGRTTRIMLGTAVIVLPWNNPLQIAEQIAVLEIVSKHRGIFCFGRGKSVKEYDGFGISIEQSTPRFHESVSIITGLLSNDVYTFQGEYYQIPPVSLHPKPAINICNKLYGASGSMLSLQANADMGLGLLTSCTQNWQQTQQLIEAYYQCKLISAQLHQDPIVVLMIMVHESSNQAKANAAYYLSKDLKNTDEHYGFSHRTLSTLTGYESYQQIENYFIQIADAMEHENALTEMIALQVIGNPAECIAKIIYLYYEIGIRHFAFEFSFGGMPFNEVRENMNLFAQQVLPDIKRNCL